MNLKRYTKISALGLAALVMSACDKDFDAVNTNPNDPTTSTPELLLPTILRGPINTMNGLTWNYGNTVMQQTAKIQFTNEDRYAWGPQSDPWNSFYNAQRDVKNIIEVATASNQNNYRGVALVMKSWMYSILTDAYGDIPYSEATKGKGDMLYYAKYDRQEDIYKGLLADLEEANRILGTTNEILEGDILFNGSVERWKKFANSLRLRLLLRQSERVDPSAAMREIVSNPAEYPIFESNEDQAALQYRPEDPNQWPLYTTRAGSYDELRLSAKMEATLKAYDDPRLRVYAQPTTNSADTGQPEYTGVLNGLNDEEALIYKGGSNFVSRVGLLFACWACGAPAPNAAQGLLMSYSELQFILAEAAERGYISGDAGGYYEEGIRSSFAYYADILNRPGNEALNARVDYQPPGPAYYSQPEVAYTGSQAEKLRKIGMQKWVSLFFNGLEAWFDWRRTGIPEIIPGPGNVNGNRVPVRFLYPTQEQALNRDNYQGAISQQGPDDLNTRTWWDVE